MMCDASDFAIGAVLGQGIDKSFHAIHYASKTISEVELNYATIEKELLAIIMHWRNVEPIQLVQR